MKGRRQKNFQGDPTEKRSKNSIKDRKTALLSLFQGAKKKRPKNSTIKPLFIISVLCMKIQGGATTHAADTHESMFSIYATIELIFAVLHKLRSPLQKGWLKFKIFKQTFEWVWVLRKVQV